MREDAYHGAPVIALFENLLLDSETLRRRVAEKVGADGTDAYSLLSQIGRDCVGALQFLPADDEAAAAATAAPIAGQPVSDKDIGILLRNRPSPLGLGRD